MREQMLEMVRELEQLLEKVPGTAGLRKDVVEMRKLLLEQRNPRLALVGRRGSGKSSLINAIFGEPVADVGHTKSQTGAGKWWEYTGELGTVEILDTRGLQEGSKPDEADEAARPLDSILEAVKEKEPDAILFLIKAKEVDAAIDGDIAALVRLIEAFDFPIPIVGVITHVDELEPKNVRLHEPGDEDEEEVEEKLQRVKEVGRLLEQKLTAQEGLKRHLVAVLGVSSYMSWRRNGTLRADERWHIDHLISYLFDELPDEALVAFARLSRVRQVQRKIATKLTRLVASLCGGIAATPIPVGDLAPITSLQLSLVAGIAYVSGREMTVKTAAEFLAAMGMNVGAGFALRETARALIKVFAPGAGSAISAAVAFGATYSIGKAATAYFIDEKSLEQSREVYDQARAEGEPARG